MHSATTFLGGHGTMLGGVVVESGRFDWGDRTFPQTTEPVEPSGGIRWWANFGEYGFLTTLRSEQLRDIGPSLSPQSALQLLQGVETLPQRIDAHLEGARAVARWLEADDRAAYVTWAGTGLPPARRARRAQPAAGADTVFAVGAHPPGEFADTPEGAEARVAAGRATGEAVIANLQLASHLATIGDPRPLVIHPASTTHRQLTPEQLLAGGVRPDLIRISVGASALRLPLGSRHESRPHRRGRGPDRHHGPLPEDRARLPPRRPAPGRLRHRRDQLPPPAGGALWGAPDRIVRGHRSSRR